jgi:hypothetical protein
VAYSRHYPVICLEVLRKATKGLTKDCSVLAKIRSRHLLNAIAEHYHYTILIGGDGDCDSNAYNENNVEDNNYDDSKQEVLGRINHLLSFDTTQTA